MRTIVLLCRQPLVISDRERGADIARYASTVREQWTPYVAPMECGNHGDARWCALTRGPLGPGLRVDFVPQEGLGAVGGCAFSALPFADEQFDKAKYARDLPASSATAFCLTARTLGVGSASCGPATFAAYRIYSDPTVFAFRLTLWSGGTQASARLPAAVSATAPPVLVQQDAQGLISPGNAPAGVAASYALAGAPFQPYTAPCTVPGGSRLRVQAARGGAAPFIGEFVTNRVEESLRRRRNWTSCLLISTFFYRVLCRQFAKNQVGQLASCTSCLDPLEKLVPPCAVRL